jgi:hypothetical protein
MNRALPPAVHSALSEYAARLRAVFGERFHELRVFGSLARGEAHEGSDIDVLVLIEHLTDLEIATASGEVGPVILRTGLPLAPLPMSPQRLAELARDGRGLAHSLEREGIKP